MQKVYDIVILGAGASALMCAAHLPSSMKIALIEHNDKVAKKVAISGGGKCNITNISVSPNNYDGDETLLEYVFSLYSKENLLTFLEQNHIALELRKNQYYFCKKSAYEIINLLIKKISHHHTMLNQEILSLNQKDGIFTIKTSKTSLQAKKVIVATGGKSFSKIGGSDIGLQIAQTFQIPYKDFSPALVGLTLQKEQFWMKKLSGLSCPVAITSGEKVLKEDLLFTHKGISGPAVLSASLYWLKGSISIDFLPNHTIHSLLSQGKNKLISSVLPLPKRLSKAILEALEISDTKCSDLSKNTQQKLQFLHNYSFSPAGNFGFSKAEVSRGGVLSKALNPYTLESLEVPNLYFIGEVVDVTGELGGYNFQWAFSSGVACAINI